MTQPTPKKTSVKKTTKKKLLNKLPINLAAYNYEAFSYKDMQRAVNYFQTELSKIEKLLSKLPIVTQESKGQSLPVSNPYMNIYNGQAPTQLYNNQIKPPTSKPEVVAPPLPYQPYTSGLQGDHMEMPSILGSSGIVVNTLKEDYQGNPTTFKQIETAKLPVIEDNSAELRVELKNLINPTN